MHRVLGKFQVLHEAHSCGLQRSVYITELSPSLCISHESVRDRMEDLLKLEVRLVMMHTVRIEALSQTPSATR